MYENMYSQYPSLWEATLQHQYLYIETHNCKNAIETSWNLSYRQTSTNARSVKIRQGLLKVHSGLLTLTLPGLSAGVSGSLDSYCSLEPLCSGMGEVVPARTSPTVLPPSPRTVLSLSCFKVSQCINCRDWHF